MGSGHVTKKSKAKDPLPTHTRRHDAGFLVLLCAKWLHCSPPVRKAMAGDVLELSPASEMVSPLMSRCESFAFEVLV